MYQVFVPIDDREKPVGDRCYVPEDLFGELERRAAARTAEPQGWLLNGALYRGSLAWEATPERLSFTELRVMINLLVLGRQVHVRIPLGHEGVQLAAGGAVLEGRPLLMQWPMKGGDFEFNVADPGQYRLELSLKPEVQSRNDFAAFDLRIPRLATSRLELSVPRDAPAIDVLSAAGLVTRQIEPSRIVAQIGPADRLRIRWVEGAERGMGSPAINVDELLHLKVQPGAMVLESLWRLKVVEGRARQLCLAADPRLRLLPTDAARSWLARVETAADRPQRISFHLARPLAGQLALRADFLVADSQGVGNVRLPYLEATDARTVKRWLAVSIDPGMQFSQQGAERLQAVAVSAFQTAWGDAKIQPRFVHGLSSADPPWSLSVRPDPPRTAAEQTLTLGFGLGAIETFLEAQLTTRPGARFQYRIFAPKTWKSNWFPCGMTAPSASPDGPGDQTAR